MTELKKYMDNNEFDEKELKFQREEAELQDAKEVMNLLSNYVNYRKSSSAFSKAFMREHRTLQQSMFKMFLELTEQIASDDYRTDGRNEDSKTVAKQLIEGFKAAKKQEYIKQGASEQRAEEYVSDYGPSKYLPFI